MPTKKLTAEERATLLDSQAERARKTIAKAREREKKLRVDKKINIHSFLEELTGIDDISLSDFLQILDQSCQVRENNGDIKPHTVREIIHTKSVGFAKMQEKTCKQQPNENKTSIPVSHSSNSVSRERSAISHESKRVSAGPTA